MNIPELNKVPTIEADTPYWQHYAARVLMYYRNLSCSEQKLRNYTVEVTRVR